MSKLWLQPLSRVNWTFFTPNWRVRYGTVPYLSIASCKSISWKFEGASLNISYLALKKSFRMVNFSWSFVKKRLFISFLARLFSPYILTLKYLFVFLRYFLKLTGSFSRRRLEFFLIKEAKILNMCLFLWDTSFFLKLSKMLKTVTFNDSTMACSPNISVFDDSVWLFILGERGSDYWLT